VRLVDIALQFAPNRFAESLSSIIDSVGNAVLGGHADVMASSMI